MKRNFKKRWEILRSLWQPFTESGVSGHAAASCFYILLSVLPASALGLTAFSLFSISTSEWYHLLVELLPAHFLSVAEYLLNRIEPQNPAALFSLWAVLTLWSASKGVMAMIDGLSSVLSASKRRGFLRRRLDAMIVFLLLSAVLISTLVIHVFGKWFLIHLCDLFPKLSSLLRSIFKLRHLSSVLILTVLLSVLYRLLPGGTLSFSGCLKGGITAAVGWITVSSLFSVYVNHFQSYQRLYGSLGLLLLACLWLQICVSILLYSILLVKLLDSKAYHPIAIIRKAFS